MKPFNTIYPVFYFDAIWISRDHKKVNYGQTGRVYIQNNLKFFLPDGSGDAIFCYNGEFINLTERAAGLSNGQTDDLLWKQESLRGSGAADLQPSLQKGRIVANRSVWSGFRSVLSKFITKRILFK